MKLPTSVRAVWRQLRFGAPTLLGRRSQGFCIPCQHANDVRPPSGTIAYPALVTPFRAAEPQFVAVLDAMDRHAVSLLAVGESSPPGPRWRQDWFPRLDAACAYVMVRERAPARLIEVGSGHSTRWFSRAALDAGSGTRITAIDPHPRASVTGLPIDLIQATVQRVGETPFADLAAGDVLSWDGSHVLMPGTDVDFMLTTVLPRLPAGVLVHIHDVFLPDGYPS
jgi:Methyltransferase domain